MFEITFDCRSDTDDLFRIAPAFDGMTAKLNHTPFLAFLVTCTGLKVITVRSLLELLTFPDETPVMVQWPGTWRSDYFHFTVGQYKAWEARQADVP